MPSRVDHPEGPGAHQAEDLARLHEISTRLFATTDVQPAFEEVLDAAIALLDADFGHIQRYDPESRSLKIAAQRGFEQTLLDYFNTGQDETSTADAASKRRARVIVEDILSDPFFRPHLEIVAAAGYRSMQSTPLFSHAGRLLGMISTYFRPQHRPSARTLGVLDLYAVQAAGLIERRQAEAALRASDNRLRRCFELGLVGMAITSPTKGILEVNDQLCRILGYERSELLHRTWAELTYPDDLAADLAQYDRVIAGEIDGYSTDKRWIRKDGRLVDSIMAVRCQRRADGSVDYFVGLVEDITERKRAETESIALKNALGAELAAMTRLHEFSTKLLAETNIQRLLEDVLDAIMALQGADLGILQLYHPETRTLKIVAQRGFGPEAIQSFQDVRAESGTACGRALREQKRVIVEDVETDPEYGPYREVARAAGFRAVQSTPMFSRTSQPLGVISTNFRLPHRPSDDTLRMTDLYARQAAEMIQSKQSEVALRRYQRERQQLTTRLIEAQEVQSKHLARELHDVFSQRLAAIGMELARLAEAPLPGDQTLGSLLLKLTEDIGTLANDIHGFSRQIHPAILDDLGLAAAIRSECLAFSEQYGMPVEFTADALPPELPEDVALCFYRIAQESLRNIGKHAGISQVSVRLRVRPGELVLAIQDAGHGIDPDSIRGKRGLGLVSMEERLRIVGGTLSIRSQRGSGTHVEARVPIAP